MEVNGIAWMIAGGVRAESLEDQRQQRTDLAHLTPDRSDTLLRLRGRIAAIVGGRPVGRVAGDSLSADCCPA